jgi:hypothetical protein
MCRVTELRCDAARVNGGIIVKRAQRIVSQAQRTQVFVIQFLGSGA